MVVGAELLSDGLVGQDCALLDARQPAACRPDPAAGALLQHGPARRVPRGGLRRAPRRHLRRAAVLAGQPEPAQVGAVAAQVPDADGRAVPREGRLRDRLDRGEGRHPVLPRVGAEEAFLLPLPPLGGAGDAGRVRRQLHRVQQAVRHVCDGGGGRRLQFLGQDEQAAPQAVQGLAGKRDPKKAQPDLCSHCSQRTVPRRSRLLPRRSRTTRRSLPTLRHTTGTRASMVSTRSRQSR